MSESALSSSSAKSADGSASGPNALILFLFILSGATGLIYELVWTRELIFVFGGTTHAISTVLVAFMGGLGLGCWIAGRVAARIANPGRAYGLIEIAIGLYAIAAPWLLHAAEPLYRALYPHVQQTPWMLTAVRFLIGAIVLLVPTTMMGATLPLLVRYATAGGGPAGRWVGVLYGINTLGAVVGTLAAGFVLIPQLGLVATTRTAAALNIGIGIVAVLALRRTLVPDAWVGPDTTTSALRIGPGLRRFALFTFAVSGFAAMVYQIAWTRALILSIGSSTYSFTCILAAFILGLALGSLWSARMADRSKNPVLVAGVIQVLVGLAAVLISPAFGYAPLVAHKLVQSFHTSFEALLAVEFVLLIAITLVPTMLMGALFPHFARIAATGGGDAAAAAGRAYAVNTLGTIAGSFLAGFVIIRGARRFDLDGSLIESTGLGAQGSIALAAGLCAVLGAGLVCFAGPLRGAAWRRSGLALAGAACVFAIAGMSARWDADYLSSGPFRKDLNPHVAKQNAAVVFAADGVDMTVGVARSRRDPHTWTLTVNGKPDASTAVDEMSTQLLLGHIPMLLRPDARRVCVIGLGSGMTLSACARHPQVERLDCIEISEEVIRANEFFVAYTYDVLRTDPRVRSIRADGRNHLLLTDQTYDVIISEPSNPWIAGVANLFTGEFFELARARLAPGGVLTLWLQGYSISEANFKLIVRTLASVFPHVTIWETAPNDYALLASMEPIRTPLADVERQFAIPAVRADLFRIGMGELHRVLARMLTGAAATREWCGFPGNRTIHTDDNALIEFSAPRELFRGEDLRTFSALLTRAVPALGETVIAGAADTSHSQLRERINRAMEARKLRLSIDELKRSGGNARDIAQLALEACGRNPGDFEAYQRLREAAAALDADRDNPANAALLDALRAQRPPTLAARTGETLGQIAAALLARAARDETAQSHGWVTEDRDEAASLNPNSQ